MNKRTFRREADYSTIDPPWFGENENVIMRIFRLQEELQRMQDAVNDLKEFDSKYEEGPLDSKQTDRARLGIHRLMDSVEVFLYVFDDLVEKRWFLGFKQDIDHAYWRVDEGRFIEAPEDEETLRAFAGEVKDILSNVSAANHQGPLSQLYEYIERMGYELPIYEVPDEFEADIHEARDQFCLGYYSTGLLVLGRAVEKALLQLGQVRKVVSAEAYGNSVAWQDTKFWHKNVALNRIDMPEQYGKVLSKKQFHQISILVDYRNKVAHSEYEDIGRDQALRQMLDAADLLIELNDKIEKLRDMDEEKIDPVENQSVQ